MAQRKKIITAALVVFGWGLLGALLGLGTGYWTYVKKPAVFAAIATLQIESSSVHARTVEDSTDNVAAPASKTPSGDAAPHQSFAAVDVIDDSHLFVSDAVLSEAVKIGRLNHLPEFENVDGGRLGQQPSDPVQRLRMDLQIRRVADASSGVVYQIEYLGATPSSAQNVVNAVVSACQQTLSQADNLADWQESMQLLITARADIERRIDQLRSELQQVVIPGDAVLRDENQTVISAAAEQWRTLRSEAYQLQQQRGAVERMLRQTETRIAAGASAETILAGLGQLTGMPQDQSAQQQQHLAMERKAEERKRQQAERAGLVTAVERELAPLQQELNSLLQKLGSEHPTVRHVRAQITKVRSKLDAIPPLEPEMAENKASKPKGSPAASDAPGPSKEAIQITILLRAARVEKQRLDDQLVDVSDRLDAAAEELARQEQGLLRQRLLQREIQQQQQLREQTLTRLSELAVASPFPGVRLTVLQSAFRGTQVSPQLVPHLAMGGGIGLLAGFVLGCLLLAFATGRADGEFE